MQVKHWPKEEYGKFYNGDSYIILNTNKEVFGVRQCIHNYLSGFSRDDKMFISFFFLFSCIGAAVPLALMVQLVLKKKRISEGHPQDSRTEHIGEANLSTKLQVACT